MDQSMKINIVVELVMQQKNVSEMTFIGFCRH